MVLGVKETTLSPPPLPSRPSVFKQTPRLPALDMFPIAAVRNYHKLSVYFIFLSSSEDFFKLLSERRREGERERETSM